MREQLASDAATAPRRVSSHFQNLHIAVDHPAAGIPHKRAHLAWFAFARVRRPPVRSAPRDLVGHERLVPRIASHDGATRAPRRTPHGKRRAACTILPAYRRSHENRLLVKRGMMRRPRSPRKQAPSPRANGRATDGPPPRRLGRRAKVRIGNARLRLALAGRTFASRAGCTGTLVFFRIGQARVHGERKRRVMTHCVERVAFPAAPRSLKREEKPRARRRPCVLGKSLPA